MLHLKTNYYKNFNNTKYNIVTLTGINVIFLKS